MYGLKNKKGLSDLVAVVLLILVTLTAVYFLFIYTKENLSLSPQIFSCADLQIAPPIKLGDKVCYNLETKDIEVEIERPLSKSDKIIESIDFTFIDGSLTFKHQCSQACGGTCYILSSGKQIYYLAAEKIPLRVSIGVNGCASEIESREITICSQ